LPKEALRRLQAHTQATISEIACWEEHLDALGVECARHRRIATEGALLGGLIEKGFSLDLVIVSDGAGQFAILLHALCWVHAERLVHKRIPLNDQHRQHQERVRGEIWDLYADLKAYRRNPDPALAPALTARFDAIFTQSTSSTTRATAARCSSSSIWHPRFSTSGSIVRTTARRRELRDTGSSCRSLVLSNDRTRCVMAPARSACPSIFATSSTSLGLSSISL